MAKSSFFLFFCNLTNNLIDFLYSSHIYFPFYRIFVVIRANILISLFKLSVMVYFATRVVHDVAAKCNYKSYLNRSVTSRLIGLTENIIFKIYWQCHWCHLSLLPLFHKNWFVSIKTNDRGIEKKCHIGVLHSASYTFYIHISVGPINPH